MTRIHELRTRIKLATEIHDLMPIIRRYFVIGAFDGALTIMGVILGAYAAGHLSTQLIIVTGFAAGIGLAVSSAVGAFEAERIESALEHKELERAMLMKVEGDRKDTQMISNLASAIVHGIAPLIAAFVPLVPFFFLEPTQAMMVAIVTTLTFLFIMGAYLGSLLKEMILYTALRFVAAGLITAILVFLIGAE